MALNSAGENSKQLLLQKAREEFALKGYANASTTEIVELAQVTRGALYYHFKDKKHLFSAVYQAVNDELLDFIHQRIASATSPWDKLVKAFEAIFDQCANPNAYRILFEDAPLVIELHEKMSLDSVLQLFNQLIQECESAGYLSPPSAKALCHHFKGAVQETAYMIIHQPDNLEYKEQAVQTFMYMLNSLKKK